MEGGLIFFEFIRRSTVGKAGESEWENICRGGQGGSAGGCTGDGRWVAGKGGWVMGMMHRGG